MNLDFASYTRSAAFHLTLSEAMIEAVLAIGKFQDKYGYGILANRMTSNALYRRGLIELTKKEIPREWKASKSEGAYCYELTRAGQLVREMLGEAGFMAPHPIDLLEDRNETPDFEVKLKEDFVIGGCDCD